LLTPYLYGLAPTNARTLSTNSDLSFGPAIATRGRVLIPRLGRRFD
jgi:hypothetical protein